MRGVLVEVPDSLIAERKRLGLWRYDEMWEGVLHMAAAPRKTHQRLVIVLARALFDGVEAAGLEVCDGLNVCQPDAPFTNYRIPDVLVVDDDPQFMVAEEFGVTGGVRLAVEIRSPNDEAFEKVGFYAERGVTTLVIIDPIAQVVVRYDLQADGTYADTRGPGPIDIGFDTTVAVDFGGRVTVSCPTGTWRA